MEEKIITSLAAALTALAKGNTAVPFPEAGEDFRPLSEAFETLRAALLQKDEAAREKEKARERAVRTVAHDLRVPLTTILGYTEALEKGLADTQEKRARYLAAIALRGRDMSRLIDTLSLAARTGGMPALTLRQTDWPALIRQELARAADFLEEHHITVTEDFEGPISLPLDEDAFRRILTNLLTNTVKYRTAPASRISVSLIKRGDAAVFSYHDDGPGVPDALLPRLFEEGMRGNETAPGSGLGLYIVSKIAAAHHGKAAAYNNNGLTIEISLPITGGPLC